MSEVTTRDIILRLEGKVDSLLVSVTTATALQASMHDQIKDHERRLRFLEKWRYTLPTAAITAVGALALGLVRLFINSPF